MPGLRFKLSLVYAVTKHPWVQVPAGQIGVVIAQVGQPLPIGAKSAVYKPEFGNFTDLNTFIEKRRTKGRAEAGVVARHTGADSSRGIPGDHQAGGVRRNPFPPISARWLTRKARSPTRRSGSRNGNSKSLESLRIRPRPGESST